MLVNQNSFRFVGEGVRIHEFARFIASQAISIGEGTQIDDFVLINGGKGVVFGRYNHITSFVSVTGGGELITGDYVGFASGCRILTGIHEHRSGMRMVSPIPREQQDILIGKIVLENDVFIGCNAVIFPNVTIGEGAMVGACSVVTHDLKPWTINVGMPARVVGQRPRMKE